MNSWIICKIGFFRHAESDSHTYFSLSLFIKINSHFSLSLSLQQDDFVKNKYEIHDQHGRKSSINSFLQKFPSEYQFLKIYYDAITLWGREEPVIQIPGIGNRLYEYPFSKSYRLTNTWVVSKKSQSSRCRQNRQFDFGPLRNGRLKIFVVSHDFHESYVDCAKIVRYSWLNTKLCRIGCQLMNVETWERRRVDEWNDGIVNRSVTLMT